MTNNMCSILNFTSECLKKIFSNNQNVYLLCFKKRNLFKINTALVIAFYRSSTLATAFFKQWYRKGKCSISYKED